VARRLSDIVAGYVEQAIRGLPDGPGADTALLEWEVLPGSDEQGGIRWLIGIGMPAEGTDDYVMPFAPVADPHDGVLIARVVEALHAVARTGILTSPVPDGTKRTAGGLIVS
jgi:hypothetical protein